MTVAGQDRTGGTKSGAGHEESVQSVTLSRLLELWRKVQDLPVAHYASGSVVRNPVSCFKPERPSRACSRRTSASRTYWPTVSHANWSAVSSVGYGGLAYCRLDPLFALGAVGLHLRLPDQRPSAQLCGDEGWEMTGDDFLHRISLVVHDAVDAEV